MHHPFPTVPVQLSLPSLTVTSPVGLPPGAVTLKCTVTGCLTRDGLGLCDVIVIVVGIVPEGADATV